MTIKAGVWISDHMAIVIFVKDEGSRKWRVMSDPDTAPRVADTTRVKNHHPAHDSRPEGQRQTKEIILLDKCYDEVIGYLHDADTIHIHGPVESKRELAERIRGPKLPGHIVHVGAIDHMTDREIVGHLRRILAMGSSPEGRFEPEFRKSNHLELA